MLSTKSQSPIEIGRTPGKSNNVRHLHAGDGRTFMELALKLNHAVTLRSVTDTVADYCGKALGIPAGMIFVERNKNLHLISWWRATTTSTRHLEEVMKEGPVV